MGHLCKLSRAYRSVAPLFTFLVLLVCSASTTVATPSPESLLRCAPAEAVPYGLITCVIEVRDAYQEPTMIFEPSRFAVSARSSNLAAVVKTSELVRGKDVTTALFTLSASAGGEVLIRVYVLQASAIGGTSVVGEVRNSGITVSVLSSPAASIGALTCTAQDSGLALRSSTLCRAVVSDETGAPSFVHSTDILFTEVNALGSFNFISGTRELLFRFTAPPITHVIVSTFTLKVRLRDDENAYVSGSGARVQFPLLYPLLQALAATTILRCAVETSPISCSVRAADAEGPVAFNPTHFRVRLVRRVHDVETTSLERTRSLNHVFTGLAADEVDMTNYFTVSFSRSPARPDVGLLSWEPKSNDGVFAARLHLYASADGKSVVSDASFPNNTADVAGSPYDFAAGTIPNPDSVVLRGCREVVLASGNTTVCFINLANDVSGDATYYIITTSQPRSFISNITYVAFDAVCRCRALWFTYHAPDELVTRVDDYINVSLYTDFERSVNGLAMARGSPLLLDVFPAFSATSHDSQDATTSAVLVAVGFLFYGGVLGVGAVQVVHRSRKSTRIRHERALRERLVRSEMTPRTSEGVIDPGEIANRGSRSSIPALVSSTSNSRTAQAAPHALSCSGGSKRAPPEALAGSFADAGRGVGARGATAPPLKVVVSNVAVLQDRLHSDSD